MEVKGSVCYITGCNNAGGIGRSLVERLIVRGAKVCAVDLDVTSIQCEYGSNKEQFTAVKADITDWKQYLVSFGHAVETFGRIDAVFLNAAAYEPFGGFWEDKENNSYTTINLNLSASLKGTRIAIDRFLMQNSPGLVVVTGSVAAQTNSPKTPMYASSKWAVEGFVRSLGFLDEKLGIRVTVIEPGMVKVGGVQTPFWRQIGMDENNLNDADSVPLPSIIDAFEDIIVNKDGKIPGGTAYEINVNGPRVYHMGGERSQSRSRNVSDYDAIVENLRSILPDRQRTGAAV